MRNLLHAVRGARHPCVRVPLGLLLHARLSLGRSLLRLPIHLITDEFAFGLSPTGWNYYCALLEEHTKAPYTKPEDTVFWRFFKDEHIRAVKTLNDLLYLHDPGHRCRATVHEFYLGTYPWGGLTRADSRAGGRPFGWHYDAAEGSHTRDLWGYGRNLWYQPGDPYTLRIEHDLTIRLCHDIRKGYHPILHGDIPSALLLVRRDGERRALIRDGHHRLAALRHLRYQSVIVAVTDIVRECDVMNWHFVKRGLCSPEQALDVFASFFTINGSERLAFLKLDRRDL